MWKRLIFLRDSSTASATEKLNELLGYEACSYKFDSTYALLLQRIGAGYFFEADFLKAAQYMQRAIDSINVNANKSSVNTRHNIRNYYSLGWIYDSLNNVTGKMKFMDSCIAMSLRYNSTDIYLIKALLERVVYFFDVGDYYRCIDYATMCERYAREHAGSNSIENPAGADVAVRSLLWKVNALLILRDPETAERLLANKINECKKSGQEKYLATIYSQLAEVNLQKGDPKKALVNYKQALRYAGKTRYDLGCKIILNNIGYNVYFLKLNEVDSALDYCKKAVSYINRDENEKPFEIFESVNILGNIANLYARKENYDSAFFYYRLALEQIKPGANEASLLQGSGEEFARQKKMHYLAGLLIDKGDAFIHQYKSTKKTNLLQEAIAVFKVADKLMERIKGEQRELPSQLFWRANSRRLYENAIEACFLLSDENTALYFFERSRAVLLNDQLTKQRWVGESDILKQTQVKKEILQLETELTNTDATLDNYKRIKKEIFSAKQELDRLEHIIKTVSPLYFQHYLDTGFITLEYVQQKLLKDDRVLLEIFSGDSAVYVLQVTNEKCYLTKIDKLQFESVVNKYISYISNPDRINLDFDGFVNLSSHLYDLIFRHSPLPGDRIIISPDGQYFPFEPLVTSRAGQRVNWFLNDHAVSYTYSARFLMNDFSASSKTTAANFMGVAPVRFPSSFSLTTLSGSDQSLNTISSFFRNALILSADQASKSNFLLQYSNYSVIHLYTHASDSSSKSSNEPVIYFADSALYLSDLIGGHKPRASLIVLAACETGKGTVHKGEGVFSFNRGFAALGIPAAITNLWTVDSESTYRLTELFYKWLAKELPSDVALQKAKLEFLQTSSKEKSIPYYWAAPVLVGKAETIEFSRPMPWKWIILFAGVGIGILVFWISRKWTVQEIANL